MIVLSNAHTLYSPGAKNNILGIDEYHVSCDINRRISNLINKNSLCPIYIIDTSLFTSYNESLREKVRQTNTYNPKLAIEIHLNANEDESVFG